ncbi:right-handed parallel beta-helix repeat-containing protein [Bacteroides sp.]|uniref:right-handed parallel beta-helix repeat-containing protein n=1 Tax=Bacteroides sp. TaxID=29523 RepID=UPI00262CE7EB|nr:right-handed parallel beta-helix repeat-containing protein [Bacteroides sp.]MDD3038996.1 right-handed parallel beta-helix repeat-containing protein [Bacteroides sp.]
MSDALKVKIGETWTTIADVRANVGGVWKEVTAIYSNVGGVWKEIAFKLDIGTIITPDASASQISSMMNEAADGTTFYFAEGTYSLNAPIQITRSNICLSGTPGLTVLSCDFVTSTSGVIDIRGVSGTVVENICIHGLTINGNRLTSKQGIGINCDYVGSTTTTRGTSGINKMGISISQCVIEQNSSYGIYLQNSANCSVDTTTVQNNNSIGIHLNSSSNNNTVTGNTCQNNASHGIYLNSSSNNTVTGNTLQNNTSHGISLNSSNNNTVTGNTCQNNASSGIYLNSSSNNTITGNTIQNNNGNGISLNSSNNNTVTGNTVQNNNNYGIRLESSSNNNTITGNTCQNNAGKGIYLYSSNNNTVTGNIIKDNNSTAGIYLASYCNYNVICSNQHTGTLSNSGTGNKVYNNKLIA